MDKSVRMVPVLVQQDKPNVQEPAPTQTQTPNIVGPVVQPAHKEKSAPPENAVCTVSLEKPTAQEVASPSKPMPRTVEDVEKLARMEQHVRKVCALVPKARRFVVTLASMYKRTANTVVPATSGAPTEQPAAPVAAWIPKKAKTTVALVEQLAREEKPAKVERANVLQVKRFALAPVSTWKMTPRTVEPVARLAPVSKIARLESVRPSGPAQ